MFQKLFALLSCVVLLTAPAGVSFAKDAVQPAATGQDDSAKRARRKRFDVTGTVDCAQERGQALGQCDIGVAQSAGGSATAAVTFGNGFTRYLFFTGGDFMRGSATMSGVGTDTEWQIVGGVYQIRVDDQRFHIPVAMINPERAE